MQEIVQILLNLKLELKAIKLQLEFFKKSQTEKFKESWIYLLVRLYINNEWQMIDRY